MFLTPQASRSGAAHIFRRVAVRPAGFRGRVARSRAALSRGAQPASSRTAPPAGAARREGAAGGQGHDRHRASSMPRPRSIGNMFDQVNGGLRGAPKFPQPTMLEMLWRAGLAHQRRALFRDGRALRSNACARAASTIISAAAFRATRSTSNGWCRISRRCSTTTRRCSSCWRSLMQRSGNAAVRAARARRRSAGSRAK